MALYPFTASTDFAGKGKLLSNWMLQSTAGTVVTFKSGGTGGTTLFKVQLAANSSQHAEYSHGHVPIAVGSWYVDIGAGDCTGCLDLT